MPSDSEARAIAKLIEQIDDLDALRDQVGRRVIAIVLITFAFALSLLVYVVLHEGPQPVPAPRATGTGTGASCWPPRAPLAKSA